jgi:hypothetical protein
LPADPDEVVANDSDGDGLRATWLRVGLEQPELVAQT